MKAIAYHPKNTHTETCVFEQWDPVKREMGNCGKPAVGNIGKSPVCQEHFEYAIKINNCDLAEEKVKM
jgi:hypothetical protein